MKTRKPDTKQTYGILKDKSNYNISPMESSVDPRVRIAAMTVADYYQSHKSDQNIKTDDPINPVVASNAIDQIDTIVTENQGFYNNMRDFEENGRAALPWFGKMAALIPNVMDKIGQYQERQSALATDENAGYLDMVYGYSEMILDALVDLVDLAFTDTREAAQDMLCCMMFYGNIEVPQRNDIDKSGLEKVVEWLKTVKDFLQETEQEVNKGIGFVNGIAKSLNDMLSIILKVAIYGIISIISTKAEEMLGNIGDKLNVTICGKSLSDYIHLEFVNNYDEVAVFGTMLGNIVEKFENKEEPVVVRNLLALAGISNTDAYEFINYSHENYMNRLEDSKKGPDANDQDICRMCMPVFEIIQMSINQGINSSVSWLTDLTKKLLASVVNFKLNSVDFKVINIIDKAIDIVEDIIAIDFSTAKLEDCYKKVKSIKEDVVPVIDPVPGNEDPSDIGKVLKSIGFNDRIIDLPETFLKRIENRYEPKTPVQRINDIISGDNVNVTVKPVTGVEQGKTNAQGKDQPYKGDTSEKQPYKYYTGEKQPYNDYAEGKPPYKGYTEDEPSYQGYTDEKQTHEDNKDNVKGKPPYKGYTEEKQQYEDNAKEKLPYEGYTEYGDSYNTVTEGWNTDPSSKSDRGLDSGYEIDNTDAVEIIKHIVSNPGAFDDIVNSNDPKKILDELTNKYRNAARGVIGKRSVYMRYFDDVKKALESLSRYE